VGKNVGETFQRGVPGLCVHDQFGDHGIVVRGHTVSGFEAGVPAQGFAVRFFEQAEFEDEAGPGAEAVGRVFGADAGLEGVAGELDILLFQRELAAGGDDQLPLDKVSTGNGFGNRVLDLKARVHFEEPEGVKAERP